jgi:uncharacterized UPF0160 family protein
MEIKTKTIMQNVAKKHKIEEIKLIKTHGGLFHADEVCCVAILRMLGCTAHADRVFKLDGDEDESVLTLDILGAKFDHHIKDMCPAYEDGTHYASFGLLCQHLGLTEVCGEEFAAFVKAVDNSDNGEGETRPYISEVVSSFNPSWNEDGSPLARKEAFEQAVDIAKTLLERVIISSVAKAEADAIATEALEKSTDAVVELEKFVPWEDIITADTGKKVVVFKGLRNDWNARLVPVKPGSFETVAHFPKEWWGATEENLPEGITFCHASGGFMLAGTTREAVLAAARMAE